MILLKKLLKIIFVLFIVWYSTKNFYHADFKSDCYLAIAPSFLEFNNSTVKESILILKHASPKDYDDLCKNTYLINPNPNCGGYDGGCFYLDQPNNISVNISKRNPSITAAVIVHEVCHLLQYKEGRVLEEEECYAKDSELLNRIVEI